MAQLVRAVLGVHAHWTGEWGTRADPLADALEVALDARARLGAPVALDFDGRGLEEAAARMPRTLERLRAALRAGELELSGASFAQPGPQLHSGESWLRERQLGARAIARLLGRRPRALWEGAAAIAPQLPQLHAGLGTELIALLPAYEQHGCGAPGEPRAWRRWQGADGTLLRVLAADELSLAFAAGDARAAAEHALAAGGRALLCAWVPLDPARRAGFWSALERLREDERLELRPLAFSALVRELSAEPPPPEPDAPLVWAADDYFHGGAPAKNSEILVRGAALAEEQLLAAESLVALLGRMGVAWPDGPGWPAWELEEAWRELACAQHHAVRDEEVRRAGIAAAAVDRSLALAENVHEGALLHLSANVQGLEGGHLVLNPLGWKRDVLHDSGVVRNVPPFGYKVVDPYELESTVHGRVRVRETEDRFALVRGRMRVEIDRRRGVIEQITTRELPDGVLDPAHPLLDFALVRGGREERFAEAEVTSSSTEEEETDELTIRRSARGGPSLTIQVAIEPLFDAVWMRIQSEDLPQPDPGARAALGFELIPRLGGEPRIVADHAFGAGEVRAERDRARERVTERGLEPVDVLSRPFQALRFVDLSVPGRGVLYVHDVTGAFSRVEGGVRHLLSSVDPLEPDAFDGTLVTDLWIVPHTGMTDAERVRRALECTLGNTGFPQSAEIQGGGNLPATLGALDVTPDGVVATAFHREAPQAREHLERPFGGPDESVFVLRLVELSGEAVEARVRIAGTVRRAARTDHFGELVAALEVGSCPAVHGPADEPWSELRVPLRAREVATIRFV